MRQMRNSAPDKTFHVSLLANIELPGGRNFVDGIADYARRHGNWQLVFRDYQDQPRAAFLHELETTDGIISNGSGLKHLLRLANKAVPIVLTDPFPLNARALGRLRSAPAIRCNNEEIGRTAVAFFARRGFHTLVYAGAPKASEWSCARHRAFRHEAKLHRATVADCPPETLKSRPKLIDFLRRLPKPCAILAENDITARKILFACQEGDLPVPTDISVLGVDNDRLICETCQPMLSSINTDEYSQGLHAAETLHTLMERRTIPARALEPIPVRITERNSVGYGKAHHPVLGPVVAFIRDEAMRPSFDISGIVARSGFSRRHLENIFRKELGHTIKDEILSARFAKLERLLAESDMRNADLVASCGFTSESHLCTLFRQRYGMTITTYRRQHEIPRPDARETPH